MWLDIVKATLTLAVTLVKFLSDRKMLEAGEAQGILKSIREADEQTKKAIKARRDVKHTADSMRDDPNNRNG